MIASNPAVALFVARAQAAQPTFTLTQANAAAVVAICRRLDGLPLAIELVAARINLLPPAALLAGLTAQLDLLIGGARDAAVRHQTLRNCISWSYDLLSEAEQRLFWRLGAFVGGWDLDAVTAVSNEAGELLIPLLVGLVALLDKSLIVPLSASGASEPRWTMLETIREYAIEQLAASAEADTVRRQHAVYYL